MLRQKLMPAVLAASFLLSCAACSGQSGGSAASPSASPASSSGVTAVVLSDSGITVDGSPAATDPSAAVYVGADIIYYEAGHDTTYGEGTEAEAHTAEEAAAQTVVTITKPGTYQLSGTLSAGQIAVDLGEDAAEDPSAVVALILDGANITCDIAPAVIFYNVYECCPLEETDSTQPAQASETSAPSVTTASGSTSDTSSSDTMQQPSGEAESNAAPSAASTAPVVDTSAAGANVIIADGSENHISGSHVAKIYKEGTDKKLHKYDAAFYSKMSMNISGESESTGTLSIIADNEGLDSEMHLTLNGGSIAIQAQNDGINTNEDGVSVTTINGGKLYINAGLGTEGDGIDSNGYLVINGGEIVTLANGASGDGGIDSDGGIYLNGGEILALGSRNDAASSASTQPYLELSFASTLPAGSVISITDPDGKELVSYPAEKEFATLTYSSAALTNDTTYHVFVNGVQQQYTGTSSGMGGGMMGGGQPPQDGQRPESGKRPDGTQGGPPAMPDGEKPDSTSGATPSESGNNVSGTAASGVPDSTSGATPSGAPSGTSGSGGQSAQEPSVDFTISQTSHSFSGVTDSSISK